MEEEALLGAEMLSVLNVYKQQQSVPTKLHETQSEGIRSAIIQDGITIEFRLLAVRTAFQSILGEFDILSTFIAMAVFNTPEELSGVDEIIRKNKPLVVMMFVCLFV